MTLRKTGTCKDCNKTLYGDEYGPSGHKCSARPEDHMDLREVARVLSDCIFMLDASEAFECEFDSDLYQKAIELAQMFRTKTEEK